jgi:hypothetical protein
MVADVNSHKAQHVVGHLHWSRVGSHEPGSLMYVSTALASSVAEATWTHTGRHVDGLHNI